MSPCVCRTQLQSLCTTTNSFPLTLQASQRHVCSERIFWLWWTKITLVIKNYAILNKRNILMQQVTTLETWQALLFCDAMHPGICRHCKNDCVSRTTQKIQLSLSVQHKLSLLLQLSTVTISIDWTST